MIRDANSLALVAEADGDSVGNVLVSVERSVVSDHVGTLSHLRGGWLARGRGLARRWCGLPRNGRASMAWSRSRWASSRTTPAQSPSTSAPASCARGCAAASTASRAASMRDELLMAWFPEPRRGRAMTRRGSGPRPQLRRLGRRVRPLPARPTRRRCSRRSRSELPIPRRPQVVDLGAGTGRA